MKLSDLGVNVDKMKIEYQCCFCKEGTDNPTMLTLVLPNERSQTWFCHSECFTKTTGEHIDVLEDDSEVH